MAQTAPRLHGQDSSTGSAVSTSSAYASIALLVFVSRIYVGGSREGVRILTGHAFSCEEGCGAREQSESTVRVGRGRSAPFGTHAAESVAASMRQRRSLRSGLWQQRLLPTRPQLWPAPMPPPPSHGRARVVAGAPSSANISCRLWFVFADVSKYSRSFSRAYACPSCVETSRASSWSNLFAASATPTFGWP